jgi:hypothetical protein
MENFVQKEKNTNSEIEKISGGWVDRIRKITYPTVFILSAMGTESAMAAEIPKDASLDEGIMILEQAATKEDHETAAAFITLPDGTSYWISEEGNNRSVDLFVGYEGDDDERVKAFLNNILDNSNLVAGQILEIDHYHNHPMQSMFAGYSDEKFSIPPSGMGFLTDGDTGFYKNEFFESVIEQVEQDNSISINYDMHVVDAIGTWSWSYIDTENLKDDPVYFARQRLDELYRMTETQDSSDTFEERQLLHEVIEASRSQFSVAYDNWLDSSYESDSSELPALLNAYRQAGIEMSFIRHSTE